MHLNLVRTRKSGFTIVELLVVIVVIAILASVSIVAYNGIQGRARDSQRTQDMNNIVKSLELYKTINGAYPAVHQTSGAYGWEVSTDGMDATNFISDLVLSDTVSSVPVDPANSGDPTDLGPSWNSDSKLYFYYKYPAGSYGCDAARGEYYVLGVTRMDGIAVGQSHPSSPNFSCSGRNWNVTGAWVTGGYTH